MRSESGSLILNVSRAWMFETESFGAESSSPRRAPRTTTGTSIFNLSLSLS